MGLGSLRVTHVISISICFRTVVLEIGIESNTARRACCRGIILATAAVGRICRISGKVCKARALAADREPTGVIGTLELSRAVRSKIDRTFGNWATLIIGDSHGQVVSIYKGDVVIVVAISPAESPFCHGCRGNTSTSMRITQ